ncbi:MAG TPA: gliding motility-associated ABC transporter substrate-binding protein GldG [Saprospiraceae bacterium]|nr:gliding motility-associated ABC transporter substrate-binding protein GldG [Saprospiraceae bacterium]MCB9269639.1 gliding motility-associated ABC transporter substrate-binding protein GldG [Lewinellaceae bacterium]HPG06049.1 gliding motility-associated ABC transporter substrate-binding protein GldG [Saprospiraceae bacterium]HPQ98693.1 gliding motility-associated ABC transporter substrate-binding protein GldG [Saprospiraceae bacterium]HQU52866.1 gliding motility-associated ABC transporter sub
MRLISREKPLLHWIVLAAGLVALNLVGGFVYKKWDVTDDSRYTLSSATTKVLKRVPDIISIKVLLSGEIPAELRRLQNATDDLLAGFQQVNWKIQFFYEDPNSGSEEEIKQRFEALKKDGMVPTNVRIRRKNEVKEVAAFPYAIVSFGERYTYVNLLEANIPGVPPEITFNNSISQLEFKFANAIQKLIQEKKKNILFTAGHGELLPHQTQALEALLRPSYNTGRIELSSQYRIHPDVDLLIVAKPHLPFTDKDLYKIDQYIMNGGKVVWLIDGVQADLDSLADRNEFIPPPNDINLFSLLTRYGVRYNYNLVLDYSCSSIQLITGMQGDKPQTQLFPYYFFPVVLPESDNPIVKNINPINLFFASTLDTLKTKTAVKKTILFTSGPYSKFMNTPLRLSFDMLRQPTPPEAFNDPTQNLAVLLEGEFPSFFENRIKPEMEQGLEAMGEPFKETSTSTKMVIVGDGDIIKNQMRNESQYFPLGFNRDENRVYEGNKDFILNTIDYLLDEDGLIEARSKEVKLRLLNTAKVDEERGKWQLINIAFPLLILTIFGFLYQWWRRRRYGRPLEPGSYA